MTRTQIIINTLIRAYVGIGIMLTKNSRRGWGKSQRKN